MRLPRPSRSLRPRGRGGRGRLLARLGDLPFAYTARRRPSGGRRAWGAGRMAGSDMPDPAASRDLVEFIEALRLLRAWAGSPSYRSLAKRVGERMRPPQEVSPFTV